MKIRVLRGWKLVQKFKLLRITKTTSPHSPRSMEGTFFKVKSISEDGTSEVMVKPAVTNVSRSVSQPQSNISAGVLDSAIKR